MISSLARLPDVFGFIQLGMIDEQQNPSQLYRNGLILRKRASLPVEGDFILGYGPVCLNT